MKKLIIVANAFAPIGHIFLAYCAAGRAIDPNQGACFPSPTDQIIYATNSEGKKSVIASASAFVSGGIDTLVSNSEPHFVQDQRLRTSCSLTYSDHSGAISGSPQFAQVSYLELRKDATVGMVASLVLLCGYPSLAGKKGFAQCRCVQA